MIRNEFEPNEIAAQIVNGNRRTLSRAITLVESSNPDHRVQASELLNALPPAGHAIRIGLSGTPGVGKSTFIENFGLQLVDSWLAGCGLGGGSLICALWRFYSWG